MTAATGANSLVKALRSGESLPSSKMALPITLLVDALALLISANHDINQQRRDDKKEDLNLAYKTLAASDSVAGSLLYGDDLPTRIKEIYEINRVSSAVGYMQAASSSAYGERRGALRGRGAAHPYTTARGGRLTNRFRSAFLDEAGQRHNYKGRTFPKRGRFSKTAPWQSQRDGKQ